jgi:hypothetical protein
VKIERLLEPDSTELPNCRCDVEMQLRRGDRAAPAHETEIRIFICSVCGFTR